MPGLGRDLAIAHDVFRRLGPFVLHDHQQPEAELGHDLGRVRADRRGVEAPLRVRDRPGADRGARDFVEFSLIGKGLVAQRLNDDLRRLDKARPRLLHRNAEPLVFDAGGAAPEPEHAAPAAQQIEQRDLLGDAHRVVPRQYDDRGAELDALCAPGIVGEKLGRRRRHRIAGEMVFEREDRVEAERLGKIAERQMLADHRGVGPAGLAQHVERDPDFHQLSPDPNCPPRRSGRKSWQRSARGAVPSTGCRQAAIPVEPFLRFAVSAANLQPAFPHGLHRDSRTAASRSRSASSEYR